MVKISIAALIYKSKKFADWVYESVYEFTPFLQRNEAEFYFIANDPTDELLTHLQQKGYKHYVNYNGTLTEEQLFKMGYGKPEYIHRVYRGWNRAILHANGEIVVLVNSDNYFSPDWLENLLKYLTSEMVVCSKLVERKHPKHPIFKGAYHGEFGNHPDNFNKQAFLDFCDKKRITGLEAGGVYMPCMLYKESAFKVGLYPEGNIAGRSFDDVINYGDRVFFEKLRSIGIKHVTAMDSLVYHLKEGEMDSPHDAEATGDIVDAVPEEKKTVFNNPVSTFDKHIVKAQPSIQEVECFPYEAADKLLFSVIVPTYNQAEFLPQALDSLINQTYGNWEAVVVNDGSTDGTAEVLNRYAAKDSRIRVVNKTNAGVASALNEGVKAARGEWICWLSSDDMFEPDKLDVHLQAIKENPDIRFFHTNYYLFDDEKKLKCELISNHREIVAPAELQVLKFFERNYVNGISIAVHREVFDKVGYFDEKYKCSQDFDMWLRISACYRSFFIDSKTCVTRWHEKQGMRSFPEAGSYDSCRACMEFLNTHEYGDYFPLINLATATGAAKAIKETMAVVFNSSAMMYRCCFNTALLDRLCEWLSQRCPHEIKEALMPHLRSILSNLNNSSLPEDIKDALLKFSENLTTDFHYSHHDFEKEAAQYIQKLSASGESERAESIERYLSILKNPDEVKNHPGGRSGPLVSVIMHAFNASRYINKAIESVLEQDYDNFELVIVDDGSTDNTGEIIAGFEDQRIKYIHKENGGIASARNLAIQKSRGSLIIVLDANDMMMPGFISAHLREFEECPDADLVYCDDYLIDRSGKHIRVIECPEYTNYKLLVRDLFRSGFPIVPFRTCIKRSVFDKIGFYDESLSAGQDYDMMRRFAEQQLKIRHIKSALYMRRMLLENHSEEIEAQKAESLFEILGRFVDTFSCNELFPDVAWEKITPQRRRLYTRYLVAATYLAIGGAHIKTNSPPVYNRMACELAGAELNQCLQAEPDNENIRQLLKKCETQKQWNREDASRAVLLAGKG